MFGKVMLYITFGIICMAAAIVDIQKQKIYNETVAVLFVPAIVSFFTFPEIGMISRLLGAISVSGGMLLICLLVQGAFGGGDIKFMVPVGLMLGFEGTLFAGMLAVLLAGGWSLLILGRKERKFSFGPALCLGSFVALIVGIGT
jgi:leader peptidase (prepilin peptidase)/N-methyltransferase